MDTVWNHCTDEDMNEAVLGPRERTAYQALEQARIREEDEWAKRMIELYEATDRDALNEHFLSKGEWS